MNSKRRERGDLHALSRRISLAMGGVVVEWPGIAFGVKFGAAASFE